MENQYALEPSGNSDRPFQIRDVVEDRIVFTFGRFDREFAVETFTNLRYGVVEEAAA